MSKTFLNISTKKNRCQFFLDFFLFYRVSGVSQRWEFKNTTKNVLQNKSCRKVFTKNSTKNPKPTFSRFFLSRFWAFLDEGRPKTRLKKCRKNKSDPSPFSYSDPPTHHGGPRLFFLPAPWERPAAGGRDRWPRPRTKELRAKGGEHGVGWPRFQQGEALPETC
jgi:hypothetical protein